MSMSPLCVSDTVLWRACWFLALKRGCYLVTRCCRCVSARRYDASLSLITSIPGGAPAAALGPGAPSFITSQPATAAEAVSHPAQLRNRTQSGVHKYSLKGHQAARGGRILLNAGPSLPSTPTLHIQITSVPYGRGN